MINDNQSTLGGSLSDKFVCDISGRFQVKAYQRGYRWTELEVTSLLNDLRDKVGHAYCLQPVVVKRLNRAGENDCWELIDGQQRLTTLYLLVRYLKESGLRPKINPTYSIDYETRSGSASYLADLDPDRRDDNIDFHHIYSAYECIDRWFEALSPKDQDVTAGDIYKSLVQTVRVIWYEAPANLEASELFTRLNVGKIPLDDAELFKALLLSKVLHLDESAHRATEVAAQWDAIERNLRDPDVWAFLSSRSDTASPTRITLILELLVGQSVVNVPGSFRVFEALRERVEAKDPLSTWESVVSLHETLLGWYRNHKLYHKIGYLVAVGHPLLDIVELARSLRKSEFEHKLDGLIREKLDLTPSDVTNLSYERQGDCKKAEDLLLLMNVESIGRRHHVDERYPFRSHKAQNWSLEHIHAQHAQAFNKKGQREEWIETHKAVLDSISFDDDAEQAERISILEQIARLPKVIGGAAFDELVPRIQALLSLAEEGETMHSLHSISNLALLPSGANSALGNAVFEAKRRKIVEMDRKGEYVPVCTRQVFLKYFTNADAQHEHFWSLRDRESYLEAMIGPGIDGRPSTVGVVRPYLKPEMPV